MSRMQQILEKAERDGSVRRFRNLTADAPLEVNDEPAAGRVIVARQPDAQPAPPLPIPDGLGRGLPMPGINISARLVAATAPASSQSEQYRALRTRLLHAEAGSAINVIVVTSPGRGDGKSLTAANLAVTLAQDPSHRVCLVDGNLRQPQLHRLMGLSDGAGLSEVLRDQATISDVLLDLADYHLSFLPAGGHAENPAELLGSAAMRRTMLTLRSAFDRVIIDAPAVTPLADVGIVTPLVDAVVLVVRAHITSRPAIGDAISSLDESKLLGIVLNDAQLS